MLRILLDFLVMIVRRNFYENILPKFIEDQVVQAAQEPAIEKEVTMARQLSVIEEAVDISDKSNCVV